MARKVCLSQHYPLPSVERIAISNSFDVQFSSLRQSIQSLQAASVELDAEKVAAEKELKKVVQKWKKQHRKLRRTLKKVYCRLKKLFGKKCKCPHKTEAEGEQLASLSVDAAIESVPSWLQEKEHAENDMFYGLALHAGFTGPRSAFDRKVHSKPHHGFPIRELKCAVKRVRAVNTKLATFERGFISSKGIKDREWFRHLAVAPGKWLGMFH